MSQHEPRVALRQMRDHAFEAQSVIQGRTRLDLDRDRVLALAITRLLEILGEAARRVPPEVREAHPAIPWAKLTGLRNRLIHAYDQVDLDIIWQILVDDLPGLVDELDRVLASH